MVSTLRLGLKNIDINYEVEYNRIDVNSEVENKVVDVNPEVGNDKGRY